jgi:hypothetical protein
MSATKNNFSLRKNNGTRNPEMSYITFDCYHLNQARTWPGPEHRLCYKAWARADLYTAVPRANVHRSSYPASGDFTQSFQWNGK